jgi:Domain of unknown function (DUF1917)
MPAKKATSKKRSTATTATTTKRSKTTRTAAAKRPAATKKGTKAPKAPSVATAAPAVYTPEPTQLRELAPRAVAEERAAEERAAPERAPQRAAPAGERPSQFAGDYYLYAAGPEPAEGTPRRPGKWLVFVSRSRVDGLWDQVRRALKGGRLGPAAKVSTALPHPESRDPKKHVLCVYTANEDDAADVRRVRAALRELGVSWRIPYKSDPSGGTSQYEDAAGGPAAKYYE